MQVIDAITYNNERELLEIRLNILDKYVDKFVILEADKTFSGKKKPLYFEQDIDLFQKWAHKIEYFVLEDWKDEKIWEMARNSPNTEYGKGAKHWLQEFYIKEHLQDCLVSLDLNDDDLVYIGDVDEIWNPEQFKSPILAKLKLKVYSYYLNNRSNEEFWGTIVGHYKDFKGKCLNHLRTNDLPRTQEEFGWHFTSIGGYEKVKKKLTDSYTEDSYASPQVLNNLEQNINGIRDFLGRDFNYMEDDTQWPAYLQNNKFTYKHLLRPVLRP